MYVMLFTTPKIYAQHRHCKCSCGDVKVANYYRHRLCYVDVEHQTYVSGLSALNMYTELPQLPADYLP